MKKKVATIDYEGMGTHIEAYVKINKKVVTTINSTSTRHNEITEVAVQGALRAVKKYLKEKENEQRNS
jgi:hypothetical protein